MRGGGSARQIAFWRAAKYRCRMADAVGGADAGQNLAGPAPRRSHRWRVVVLFTLILLSWGWWCHHWQYLKTANEAMRLLFVQAVIETGRPELEGVAARHGQVPVDRSEFGGHVYMDKAPGASLLALPLYGALQPVLPAIAKDDLWLFGYLATLATMALPLLGALALLYRALRRHGVGSAAVGWTIAALATGSPLQVYASLFFGHALAAACILAAFAGIAGANPQGGLSRRAAWGVGLLLGCAGLTDTPVFVLAGLVAAYAVVRALPWAELPRTGAALQLPQRLARTWPVFGGLLVGVAGQLLYNTWVLGHPLRFTYQYKADANLAAIMQTGWLGFRLPQATALIGLLLSAKRGLLYHAPWLAAAVAGLVVVLRRQQLPQALRIDAAAALAMAGGYALFVSGFADWPGGDSPCARHLLPVVALIGWGLAPLLDDRRLPGWGRAVIGAACLAGVLMHLPTVATFPYHFDKLERPVLDMGVPLIIRDGFSPSVAHWMGASNYASLVLFVGLLAAIWAVGLALGRLPEVAGRRTVRVGIGATVWVVWATGMAASVPEPPGRTAEVARYRAWSMLKSGSSGKPPGVHGALGPQRVPVKDE